MGEPTGSTGPTVGPVVTKPACHGCNGGTPSFGPGEGIPVTPTGYPATGYPATGYPSIGYPSIGPVTPIAPGPTVVPSYELPNPMPVPKPGP
jgi:hypothetical protein